MNDDVKKTQEIGSGKPGPGRPKGVRNKTTMVAKEAIALAAEKLGGVTRLVEWAKSDPQNEKAFWASIYPKLLPIQVAGDSDNPIHVVSKIERVIIDHSKT